MEIAENFVKNALKAFEQSTQLNAKFIVSDELSSNTKNVLTISPDGSIKKPLFFPSEIFPSLNPGVISELLTSAMSESSCTVVITNYVSLLMAKQCKKQNIQFIDLAGNAYLHKPGFLVYVAGNPPPDFILANKMNFMFKRSRLCCLLLLLYKKDLVNSSVRAIAEQSGISSGTLSAVKKHLEDTGFLYDRGRQGREILEKEKLFTLWAKGFNEIVRPQITLGRYITSSTDWEYRAILPKGACWGGELALERSEVNDNYSGKIIIYTDTIPSHIFAQYGVRPDPHGNIEVISATLNKKINIIRSGEVHPAFIFADLLYCDSEKSQAQAQELLKQKLCN